MYLDLPEYLTSSCFVVVFFGKQIYCILSHYFTLMDCIPLAWHFLCC